MTSQGITTRKASSTFVADMRSFASVQFCVAFEIMQPPKAGLTSLADIWFFLTVGKQVTFEIVVTGKVSRTIRALVPFGRRSVSRLTFCRRFCCRRWGARIREGFV